jgi:hypothetical protein
MFIVEPLVLNKKADGPLIYYGEFIRCAALVYLGYVIQSYLIYEIWLMDLDCEWQGTDNSDLLEFVCVFVFEIAMFVEVRNACDIMFLLWVADSKGTGLESLVGDATDEIGLGQLRTENRRGAVMTEEGNVGWLNSQMRRVRGKSREAATAEWSLKSMTSAYKVWAMIFIALPKLVIGIFLAFVGGLWIPKSPTPEDIILNTLAMNFIVDIDPLMYGAFSSDAAKEDLDHMTPIQHYVTNQSRKILWAMNAFVYPVAVLALSGFVIKGGKNFSHCA